MPLPLSPGAPIFHGSDVTTLLHKYESIVTFTATDHCSRKVFVMLPYYSTEAIRETVMMMCSYVGRDWVTPKSQLPDLVRYTDSLADLFVCTRQYLEQLCAMLRASHRGRNHAEFGGIDRTESLKLFLHTFNHISGVVTIHRMMCQSEWMEMLLYALPTKRSKKAISKFSMNPLEPSTIDYSKLHSWRSRPSGELGPRRKRKHSDRTAIHLSLE
jgi:hypothetical protein